MKDADFVADLCRRVDAGETPEYLFFWGHRPGKHGVTASCLSQWYEAIFVVDGQSYATAEHFMMAEKAAVFGDEDTRRQILAAPDPKTAKALGRKVQGYDDAVWLERRFPTVVRANEAKFRQNTDLGAFLRQTGDRVLVEASPVDRVWGIGMAQDDARVHDPNLWQGSNLLGFALMWVRDRLTTVRVDD